MEQKLSPPITLTEAHRKIGFYCLKALREAGVVGKEGIDYHTLRTMTDGHYALNSPRTEYPDLTDFDKLVVTMRSKGHITADTDDIQSAKISVTDAGLDALYDAENYMR